MRITDDKVTFDPGEFSALTPFTQEAIINYYGERTPSVESAFSDVINREIQAAQKSYVPKKSEVRKVTTLEEAISIATDAEYAQVLPDINRIKAVLGIVDEPAVPAAADEAAPVGFMAKLKSLVGL